MTTPAVAGPAVGRDRQPRVRPFSVLDELNCYFDSPAEPNNVQLEVWLPGHLRPERLRAAVAAVLAAVPEARARRAARSRSGRRCPGSQTSSCTLLGSAGESK